VNQVKPALTPAKAGPPAIAGQRPDKAGPPPGQLPWQFPNRASSSHHRPASAKPRTCHRPPQLAPQLSPSSRTHSYRAAPSQHPPAAPAQLLHSRPRA
jgi:hypothetical protein